VVPLLDYCVYVWPHKSLSKCCIKKNSRLRYYSNFSIKITPRLQSKRTLCHFKTLWDANFKNRSILAFLATNQSKAITKDLSLSFFRLSLSPTLRYAFTALLKLHLRFKWFFTSLYKTLRALSSKYLFLILIFSAEVLSFKSVNYF